MIGGSALANDKLHPIKTPADLAHHVRLDYESMRDGRRLSLWDFWFDKTKIPHVKPASTLQFPQYDQLVSAAIDDGGVGIAVLPHTAQHLHRKALCVPFGMEAVALLGVFYIIRRPDVAGRDAVAAFVDWLRSEVRRDANLRRHRSPPEADPVRQRASHAAFQEDETLDQKARASQS